MAALKEKGIALLSSTASVDMQTAQKTTLYTVPSGKTAVICFVVVRSPSASLAGGTEYDFGTGDNANTWKQDVNLSSMTTLSTDVMVIDTNNTKYSNCAGSSAFGIKVITGSTLAATCTIDVFGYLY